MSYACEGSLYPCLNSLMSDVASLKAMSLGHSLNINKHKFPRSDLAFKESKMASVRSSSKLTAYLYLLMDKSTVYTGKQ